MKPYKAPGPDGFHCIFFKQYWHIIGDDIFYLVKTAFQTGDFDPGISDTLIALIPEIDPPSTYQDFRPISLCNIVYKLLTKVLVHRLRPILNNIIGPYQSSFLSGRGTSDNSIVLKEIVHFMRKSKKKKGYVPLHTSSFSASRSYLLLSITLFFKGIGSLYTSQIQDLYLIFYLQMMSSFSPRLKALNSDLSLIYLIVSARLQG